MGPKLFDGFPDDIEFLFVRCEQYDERGDKDFVVESRDMKYCKGEEKVEVERFEGFEESRFNALGVEDGVRIS